jgi:ABC-type sugar transport system ATPase subunit
MTGAVLTSRASCRRVLSRHPGMEWTPAPGVRVLDGVDLDARRGATHIPLGENGTGKSTRRKILTGVYPPDSGTILFKCAPAVFRYPAGPQKKGIRVIHQESRLVRNISLGGGGSPS